MGPEVAALEWRVGPHPEGAGPAEAADQIFEWADTGQWLPGADLLEVLDLEVELYGGEISGRKVGATAASVTVRARFKVGWEVETANGAIIAALKREFPAASPLESGGLRIPTGSKHRTAE